VQSGRVEIAFSPVEHLHGLFTIEASRVGGVGEVVKEIPFTPSSAIPGDILHTPINIGDTSSWQTYDPTSLSIDDKTYKWNFVYDALPGGAALTYTGGFDNLQFHHDTPSPGILGGPPTDPVIISYNEYPKTQNHELRISSAPTGVFTWQAGAFFFEERSNNLHTYVLQDEGSPQAAQAIAFAFPLVESTSHALFGQGSVNLSDTVKLTAGARYTDDTKERTGVEELPFIGVASVPDGGSGHWSKTTGHLGIDVAATATSFEYAKVDTGYKAGGFASCNEYQPETVTTYEMGSKNRLGGNTAQVNIAAFYSAYKNQQVSLNVPTSTCVGGSTEQNAGSSRIYGFESDINALLGPVGQLDMAITYLHARYSSFVVAPGLPAAVADCRATDTLGNCQLAGNTLPQSPTWSVVVGLDHQWQLPNAVTATGRIEGKYQSLQYFDPFNYGSTTAPGYGVANASLDFARDKWKLGVWVRNLTNRLYLVEAQEQYGFNSYEYGFGAPRTFGVRLSVSMR
jgi:iron complex outermembrane receptor protein